MLKNGILLHTTKTQNESPLLSQPCKHRILVRLLTFFRMHYRLFLRWIYHFLFVPGDLQFMAIASVFWLIWRTFHNSKEFSSFLIPNLYSCANFFLFIFLQRIARSCWQMLKSSNIQSSIAMMHFARWAVSLVPK